MSTGYGEAGGCAESVALGAYLLGALSPEERQRMERHVAGCPICRAEIVQLAPLPGLLRHTPFEELPEAASAAGALHTPARPAAPPPAAEPAGPGPGPGTVTVATPGPGPGPSQHRRPARPSRRVLVGAGLALAGAAAGAGLFAGLAGHGSNGSPGQAGGRVTATLTGTDPSTHVSATAALSPEAWGTWMKLTLNGLPAGTTCHMVVHSREGGTETAGTWGSGYSSSATVPASTSISPSDISSLTVLDATGRTLVTLPQTPAGS
ncbi:anti-sigma factor family protein [Phaeacidiphilus oryzae]|uniref:anti-sigma factor family protein n=1 Tax=Phaeacidiphilus oryzae TaxID=348818 RepID=UPI00055F2641|nr:zf-HC2 domain-containing protein [Phaeacidiphilus oryzae]